MKKKLVFCAGARGSMKFASLFILTTFLVSCGNMNANIAGPMVAGKTPVEIDMIPAPEFDANETVEEVQVEEKEKEKVSQEKSPESNPGEPTIPSVPETPKQPVAPTAPPKNEMVGPGVLKPTVYYFAVINEDKKTCETKVNLHGVGGKVLLSVCPGTLATCSLQGSCAVIQKEKTHTFNIIGVFGGQARFFEIEEDGCRFGYGVQSSCLDPFYTLAADLEIYKPGEVIYIPAVVGLVLPDGSKHTGYFVIRDQGHGIKGYGRFDFYSGFYSWNDSANPFKRIGFGDVNTNIPYFRVKGETAKKILKTRGFPQLPPKNLIVLSAENENLELK
ncbi:hypothetical protein QJS83_04630 [Bdellovibrio sp. 22V]|uniref:3D domain-containing protein n=1 Tax=Bdellovibrio TaxID=958 RepID=UPI002542DB9A|nr:3D domain-containing protein [Bdellovibrio sp. 22V]WII73158.1 hypothetical protein QJS83_04630 [Bdellovibrio sp. 22V]